MNEALAMAFGIGEPDDGNNPVEYVARAFLQAADDNPSVALRLASGALLMSEQREQMAEVTVQRLQRLVSRGFVRAAVLDAEA